MPDDLYQGLSQVGYSGTPAGIELVGETKVTNTAWQLVELGQVQIPPFGIKVLEGSTYGTAADSKLYIYAQRLTGSSYLYLDCLVQEAYFLAELIKNEVESSTTCLLKFGLSTPQERLSDISRSFGLALALVQQPTQVAKPSEIAGQAEKAELLKLDKAALENFLKFGTSVEFDEFFAAYLRPLGQATLDSYLIKNYIFIDLILTTAKFVHRLGGVVDLVIPEINQVETLMMHIRSIEQIRAEIRKIFASALSFREAQVQNQHSTVIHQAKEYIDQHFSDSELSLNAVAAQTVPDKSQVAGISQA